MRKLIANCIMLQSKYYLQTSANILDFLCARAATDFYRFKSSVPSQAVQAWPLGSCQIDLGWVKHVCTTTGRPLQLPGDGSLSDSWCYIVLQVCSPCSPSQLGTQTAVSDLVSSAMRRFRAAASSSPWMRWTSLSGSCFCLILGLPPKKNIPPELPVRGIDKNFIPGHVPFGSWSMHLYQIL